MVKNAPKERKSEIQRGIRSNEDKTKINISFWSWRKGKQKRIREKRREGKKKKKIREERRKGKEDHRYGTMNLYGCYKLCMDSSMEV